MHSKIEGPVVLSLTIYTNNHKLDTDNVLKAISDGLNGHAYNDDRQICETHLYRIWSENPRVVVEIEETEAETEHPTAA
jgi:Holliday junction resolvase RusA-like endonuclease